VGLNFHSKGMRKQSAFNLFFGEHFSSLANTFKGKKFHDLPDPRFPFEPLKLIEGLFCHGHYFDPGINRGHAQPGGFPGSARA
jgi:hypothetical protein